MLQTSTPRLKWWSTVPSSKAAPACCQRIDFINSALKSVSSSTTNYVHLASRQSLLVISSTGKSWFGIFLALFLFSGIPGSVVLSSKEVWRRKFSHAPPHSSWKENRTQMSHSHTKRCTTGRRMLDYSFSEGATSQCYKNCFLKQTNFSKSLRYQALKALITLQNKTLCMKNIGSSSSLLLYKLQVYSNYQNFLIRSI